MRLSAWKPLAKFSCHLLGWRLDRVMFLNMCSTNAIGISRKSCFHHHSNGCASIENENYGICTIKSWNWFTINSYLIEDLTRSVWPAVNSWRCLFRAIGISVRDNLTNSLYKQRLTNEKKREKKIYIMKCWHNNGN